ncbi:helix-turn-helix domain-containing protein [Shimia ponticola]|uniref:helix-turn-helix domain-containing protein n=1 Tax=Shimia ponticola TaxID=2582893 RepID=UPI0011BE8A1C|nr:helix-turn-helix domain-containing protein [Shimia ponticola]
MIGRWGQSEPEEEVVEPKGFDDFDLKLGDVMRGERATMGKSLLDVQRELKIKASYIAAIENADPSAFDTPGFIAGFVRSYARYLNLNPDWAFDTFCQESGFEPVHGMSAEALPARKARDAKVAGPVDPLSKPAVPFTPEQSRFLETVEPRAIGSSLVLLAMIGGLGYGAWAVVQEVQRVDVAPIEQPPTAIVQLDPLAGPVATAGSVVAETTQPTSDTLDRLYRPPALDVPVLVARDAPIATLNPDAQGVFAATQDRLPSVGAADGVQVVDGPTPEVVLFAVAPTWVRVQTADQSVLFEKILNEGEEYAIPVTEETPILRAGNSGSLYFKVNGTIVGPAGEGTGPVSDVLLASTDLNALYTPATPEEDQALFDLLQDLNAPDVLPKPVALQTAPVDAVSLISANDSWVRVRNADGDVVYEGIIAPGQVQTLPEGLDGSLRAGNSGSLYFQVGDMVFGPVGPGASTARNVDVSLEGIQANYSLVDAARIPGLVQ